MAMNPSWLGPAVGGSMIGSGLFNLFGGNSDPAKGAMKYLNQIPGSISPYYNPFIEAGQSQIPGLQEQYGELMGNPGERLNEIGSSYKQSPGLQFAIQQALGGAGRAAAAGGMAGSPQHEQQNMQLATDLANQDYYKWLGGATGLYGTGLQGAQNMLSGGQQAAGSLADQIAQMLAQQANLEFESQKYKNESKGGAFGNILGGLGAFFGL